MRAKKWLLAAVGIAGLSFVGKASADTLVIGLSLNGGPITTVQTVTGTMPQTASFSGSFDGFTVLVSAGTSVNAATNSFLVNSTDVVTNVSDVGDTLNIWVSENNYTLPAGSSLQMNSGFTDTVVPPALPVQTNVFQAYEDNSNALYGTAFTNGPQTAIQIAPLSSQYSTTDAINDFNPSRPFSLSSVANIGGLGTGLNVSYTSHVDVTPTPLPTSASTGLALLAGLGVVGGVSVLRRRRQMA